MITFVTAWYIVKSKFNKEAYIKWMSNLLRNVEKFKLIIFTNKESISMIEPLIKGNDNINVIMYEWEEFSTYKLKEKWISNHHMNDSLNSKIHWKLNMLWNEKINMVKLVKDSLIFNNGLIGWCDIGYFRCRDRLDISEDQLKEWPNENKLKELKKDKIYYCKVCNSKVLSYYARIVLDKNNKGLPKKQIPPDQISIAGGFFITDINNLDWYHKQYYDNLYNYFMNSYLIKDDQILVLDTIISNLNKFELIEQKPGFDRWFGFQTFLI